MQQNRLGNTGLRLSALGLGTLTWGADTGFHEADSLLEHYISRGGNVIDTAPVFGGGAAEAVLGELFNTRYDRRELVLISKAGLRSDQHTTVVDNSRAHLLSSLDNTLAALGTDYLDIWLLQRPDPSTPLVESLEALRWAQNSGKVRYVGLSNYPAWQCALADGALSKTNPFGLGLSAVEMEYSLLERGIERELLPAAQACGWGMLAWSALGRGVLTGKYRHSTPPDSRAASAHLAGFVTPYLTGRPASIVEALATAADGLSVPLSQVALAWLTSKPAVSCALIGPRNLAQLTEILPDKELILPEPIIQALDEVSSIDLGYPETFG